MASVSGELAALAENSSQPPCQEPIDSQQNTNAFLTVRTQFQSWQMHKDPKKSKVRMSCS